MLAFLRDSNTSPSVIDVYDDLNQKLGLKLFQTLFPVILMDNGSEFSNQKPLSMTLRRMMVYVHGFIIVMPDALIRKVQLKSITG